MSSLTRAEIVALAACPECMSPVGTPCIFWGPRARRKERQGRVHFGRMQAAQRAEKKRRPKPRAGGYGRGADDLIDDSDVIQEASR